jgi:hypothetical protein
MSNAPRTHPVAEPFAAVDDPSIPLLTDRIYLPALELDIALPTAAKPAAAAAIATSPATPAERSMPRPPVAEASAAAIEIVGNFGPRVIDAPPPVADAGRKPPAEDEAADVAQDVAAPEDHGPPEDLHTQDDGEIDADIEAELDQDLVAALDADFEALLAAEAELAGTSARAEAGDDEAATAVEAERVREAQDVPEAEHDDEAGVAAQAPASREPPPATFVQVADREVMQQPAAADETAAGAGQLPTPGAQDILTTGMPAGAMSPVESEAAATTAEGVAIAAVTASGETPAAAAMPQAAAAMPGAEVAMPHAAAAPPQASPAQADALRAVVLQRVAERLPERINATVRDLMQPAIDQAMARLSEEANLALRITLQDIVEQVLREELARQSSETKPH